MRHVNVEGGVGSEGVRGGRTLLAKPGMLEQREKLFLFINYTKTISCSMNIISDKTKLIWQKWRKFTGKWSSYIGFSKQYPCILRRSIAARSY